VTKERHGARVTRRYDRAQTPYQRVLALSDALVSPAQKSALQAQYEALNPAELRRTLARLQDQLWEPEPVAAATVPITPGSD